MNEKNGKFTYSKILTFDAKRVEHNALQVIQNPVKNQLQLNYYSATQGLGTLRIFNMMGVMQQVSNINVTKGDNDLKIYLNNNLLKGIYVVEIIDHAGQTVAKFSKN